MVVANDGFFFQEYYDPRLALEAAGWRIEVASGAGGTAVPHPGSYHGRYTGIGPEVIGPIRGTRRVLDVRSADYDALVLVGGWGAGKYYFAYPGRFSDAAWQPDAAHAGAVNDLINDFVREQKRILAVCNGVNVLAWSRVRVGAGPAVSPLAGRRARAPWGSAPAQDDYLGVSYGSSWSVDQACAWEPQPGTNCFRMGKFASDNGALVPNPYDSVPGAADPNDLARRDAVGEDGPFLTVQDNFAARTAGERLAARLLGR